MIDELNREEKSPEALLADQNPPGVEKAGQSVVSEAGVVELESRLAQAEAHLIELEQVVASRESEIASLKQAKDELEAKLTTTSHSLAEAVAGYKALVVQTNPEVIGELITGDTIEAINDSLRQAKTLVSRVRQGVEAEISLARVPAGAPERTSPDLSVLSPREKIQYAIGGKR